MSSKELDRLAVVRQVLEGRLTQAKAGEFVGLSERQVRRLCAAFEERGPAGARLGQARPAEQSTLTRRVALPGYRDRARALRRLRPHAGLREVPRAARPPSVQ